MSVDKITDHETKRCMQCSKKLEIQVIGIVGGAYYCKNKKCKHFGMLTIGYSYKKNDKSK